MEEIKMIGIKDLKKGDTFPTNTSGYVEVVDFKSYNDITVKFIKSGNIRKCGLGALNRGRVKDLIYGVGYTKGIYPTKIGKSIHKSYDHWRRMLYRATSEWSLIHPSYTGVTICLEWQCYDNFYKWVEENKLHPDWELDKDLLKVNNKMYCPEFCTFLPRKINRLISYRESLVDVSKHDEYIQSKQKAVRAVVKEYEGLSVAVERALLDYTLLEINGKIKRVK